jgi:hypothetical protein
MSFSIRHATAALIAFTPIQATALTVTPISSDVQMAFQMNISQSRLTSQEIVVEQDFGPFIAAQGASLNDLSVTGTGDLSVPVGLSPFVPGFFNQTAQTIVVNQTMGLEFTSAAQGKFTLENMGYTTENVGRGQIASIGTMARYTFEIDEAARVSLAVTGGPDARTTNESRVQNVVVKGTTPPFGGLGPNTGPIVLTYPSRNSTASMTTVDLAPGQHTIEMIYNPNSGGALGFQTVLFDGALDFNITPLGGGPVTPPVAAIPLPASGAIFLGALFGLGLLRRNQRRS